MARSLTECLSWDSTVKKISLGIGFLLFIIWFVFFVLSCIRMNDGNKMEHMLSWITYEQDIQFPSFSICPEFEEGNITAIRCEMLMRTSKQNIIITPTTGNLPQCIYYNIDGSLEDFNSTIWCAINVTNNYTSFDHQYKPGNAKIFLAKPNQPFDNSCANCIIGQDFWVIITNSFNFVGFKKYMMNGNTEYEMNGFYYTYDVIVNPYEINLLTTWTSKEVWNYRRFHYFDFTEFLGTIGGIAAILMIIHSFVLFFNIFLLWR